MRASRDHLAVVEPGLVDYERAWELQREVADAVLAGTGADTLILLEHPSVYTAGRRTQPGDRPVDGSRVIDVDRGGRITWHGPGQLVAYPIVRLAEAMNVVGYVRTLEQALIATCNEVGVAAVRVRGRSGVWLPATAGRPERKVAAIGVRVAKGITSHGVALNCDPDLSAFDRIVPCGISDAGVTSLSAELGHPVPVDEVRPVLVHWLTEALDGRLQVRLDPPVPTLDVTSSPGTVDNGLAWHLAPALRGG